MVGEQPDEFTDTLQVRPVERLALGLDARPDGPQPHEIEPPVANLLDVALVERLRWRVVRLALVDDVDTVQQHPPSAVVDDELRAGRARWRRCRAATRRQPFARPVSVLAGLRIRPAPVLAGVVVRPVAIPTETARESGARDHPRGDELPSLHAFGYGGESSSMFRLPGP